MNTARRFPSVTNEGAIRPHEHAFRRWSVPDFAPTMDAFGGGPITGPVLPDGAPTDRADTMAAHNPPTFTVYTPDQMRSAPLRRSMPDYGEVHSGTVSTTSDDSVGARTLLKWTGIGIVAGLAVLSALIVVLNFGGNNGAFSTAGARSALVSKLSEQSATPAAAPKPAEPAPVAAAATPKADYEIVTPAPVASAKKVVPTAKVASTKKTTKTAQR